MGGRSGGGRGRRAAYRPMSEINVTPFVDVMLVLLIIFMVAAPMMTTGVPVDLPRTTAQPLNQEQEPLTISVDPQGRIFLQETEVQLEGLVAQLQAIARNQPANAAAGATQERRIFVRGDRAISYGRVMEVMGTISAGGFTRVALLAEQANPTARPPAAAPAGRPAATPANPSATPPARGQAPR